MRTSVTWTFLSDRARWAFVEAPARQCSSFIRRIDNREHLSRVLSEEGKHEKVSGFGGGATLILLMSQLLWIQKLRLSASPVLILGRSALTGGRLFCIKVSH